MVPVRIASCDGLLAAVGLLVALAAAVPAVAQETGADDSRRPSALDFPLGGLGSGGSGLGGAGFGGSGFGGGDPFGIGGLSDPAGLDEPKVTAAVAPERAAPNQIVTVAITVRIPEGEHTYSLDKRFTGATEIAIDVPTQLEAIEESFVPDREAHSIARRTIVTKEYEGEVTYRRQYRVRPSTALSLEQGTPVTLTGRIDFQSCDRLCRQFSEPFELTVTIDPAATATAAQSTPQTLVPEAAEPAAGEEVAFGGEMAFGEVDDTTGEPGEAVAFGQTDGEQAFGSGDGANSENSENSENSADAVGFGSRSGSSDDPGAAAFDPLAEEYTVIEQTLPVLFLSAFLGGLFLNLMPCVLPVLQLKAMSVAQMAGESRRDAGLHGVGYTLGVLLVMGGLAALMAGTQAAWGTQFGDPRFAIPVALVTFALGLSLFGVYELPLPGFVGRADASVKKEGFGGAIFSGVFATLLATPCSGPFLGGVTAKLLQQPTPVMVLLMLMIGFGLAFPFLLVSFYPALVRWLPRPGMWMVKFKQFTGFVMMAVVVWLLHPLDARFYEPVLVAMVLIGLALWMVGELSGPHHRPARRRLVGLASLMVAGLGLGLGYWLLPEPTGAASEGMVAAQSIDGQAIAEADRAAAGANVQTSHLDWEPFTEERLRGHLLAGRTVLVDFTADWCINCKVNEKVALNTARTKEFVTDHDVATLMADFTTQPPEVRKWLNKFGQDAVPLTVVIPKGRIRNAQLLGGIYRQATLLKTLEEAVADETEQMSGRERTAR